MVKIIPHLETSFWKLDSGIAPRACSGTPRNIVRLEYSRLSAFFVTRCRCRLLAIARPIEPRPYCVC